MIVRRRELLTISDKVYFESFIWLPYQYTALTAVRKDQLLSRKPCTVNLHERRVYIYIICKTIIHSHYIHHVIQNRQTENLVITFIVVYKTVVKDIQ